MNLSKVHHIAIIVSDYEAAKDFYVNKLGFSVIRENYRPERKDWKLDLRVNEHTELEIFAEENPPKRVNRPEACVAYVTLRSALIAWSRRSENWRKLALNVSQSAWMITPARR